MVSNAMQRKYTYYEPLLNKTACDFDKELKSYGLQASEG